MGLEPASHRDKAFSVMQQHAAEAARRIAAMEGAVRDTKRVKLSHFSRGPGIQSAKDCANFGAHTFA